MLTAPKGTYKITGQFHLDDGTVEFFEREATQEEFEQTAEIHPIHDSDWFIKEAQATALEAGIVAPEKQALFLAGALWGKAKVENGI